MNKAEQLLKELYETRAKAKKARQEFVKKSEELGTCSCIIDKGDCPCYLETSDPKKMCEICAEKHVFWMKSRKLSHLAAGKLRSVVSFGKNL